MDTKAILSIGVYGFSERGFFDALQRAKVDCFCDVRARRGLRGSQYAFANSKRLQARLQEIGIKYVHIKELAPSQHVREAQKQADLQHGILKRSREELGDQFKFYYAREILEGLNASNLLNVVLADSRRPVFFCVEKSPRACHRSLITEELSRQTGLSVEHIIP